MKGKRKVGGAGKRKKEDVRLRDWESQIKGIKRQGPTLGVLFTEVSVEGKSTLPKATI